MERSVFFFAQFRLNKIVDVEYLSEDFCPMKIFFQSHFTSNTKDTSYGTSYLWRYTECHTIELLSFIIRIFHLESIIESHIFSLLMEVIHQNTFYDFTIMSFKEKFTSFIIFYTFNFSQRYNLKMSIKKISQFFANRSNFLKVDNRLLKNSIRNLFDTIGFDLMLFTKSFKSNRIKKWLFFFWHRIWFLLNSEKDYTDFS